MSKTNDTKDRVLRTAARLFAQQGYHATGMAELGDAAELQRGALYYYIGSKENLLYEISSRHVAEMVEFGESVLKEDLTALQKVFRLSEQLVRTIHDDLDEITVFFREIGALTGQRRERVFALRDQFEDIWMRALQQGVNEGALRQADPLLIKAILGMHNYAYVWLKPGGTMQPEDVGHYFCDVLFGNVLTESGESEYERLTRER